MTAKKAAAKAKPSEEVATAPESAPEPVLATSDVPLGVDGTPVTPNNPPAKAVQN